MLHLGPLRSDPLKVLQVEELGDLPLMRKVLSLLENEGTEAPLRLFVCRIALMTLAGVTIASESVEVDYCHLLVERVW